MKFKVEFSGGVELLFNKQKKITIETNENDKISDFTINDLIMKLKDMIKEKQEFFLTKELTVRPGIIVLINDSDWEIFEKEHTIISDGDSISFISTLHGG